MDEFPRTRNLVFQWGFPHRGRLAALGQQIVPASGQHRFVQSSSYHALHEVAAPTIVNSVVHDYVTAQPSPQSAAPNASVIAPESVLPHFYTNSVYNPSEEFDYGTKASYFSSQEAPAGGNHEAWPTEQQPVTAAVSIDLAAINMEHQRQLDAIFHPLAPLPAPTEQWPHTLQPHPEWQPRAYHSPPSVLSTPCPSEQQSSAPVSPYVDMRTLSPNGTAISPDQLTYSPGCPTLLSRQYPEENHTASQVAGHLLSFATGESQTRESTQQPSPCPSSDDEMSEMGSSDEEVHQTEADSPRSEYSSHSHRKMDGPLKGTYLSSTNEYEIVDLKTCDESSTYAVNIYRALMSVADHRMDLGQIYKFFVETMPKYRKLKGKGWKNSVRHNLSMNGAFLKLKRPPGDDGKGCIWALSESAIKYGIRSTTRYRKAAPLSHGREQSKSRRRRVRKRKLPMTASEVQQELAERRIGQLEIVETSTASSFPRSSPIRHRTTPRSPLATPKIEPCSPLLSSPESMIGPGEYGSANTSEASFTTTADGHGFTMQPTTDSPQDLTLFGGPLVQHCSYPSYPQYAVDGERYANQDVWEEEADMLQPDLSNFKDEYYVTRFS